MLQGLSSFPNFRFYALAEQPVARVASTLVQTTRARGYLWHIDSKDDGYTDFDHSRSKRRLDVLYCDDVGDWLTLHFNKHAKLR